MTDPRSFHSLTGQDLAALRREAGLTQAELAQRAGIGRHAVIYWEQKPVVDPRAWAPCRMLDALSVRVVRPEVSYNRTNTRTRGDGVLYARRH